MLQVDSNSPADTEAWAQKLGGVIAPATVLLLSGELGAGKTVFVRGLAKGLQTSGPVTSPSYVLQHIYRGGRATLYHIDAYRLRGGADEFEASGLHEALADPGGVVCIEWPERVNDFQWPNERLSITIEHIDPQRRRIGIEAFGPRSQAALENIV